MSSTPRRRARRAAQRAFSKLVRRNPEAAAQLIRQTLGDERAATLANEATIAEVTSGQE